ncbi:MAG: hypothetical protein ACAH95_08580 [Fimbriimonas sp.]
MASAQFQHSQGPPVAAMTAQEAEEVMALWAERQQEIHSSHSLRELSEVLNAPPSEVASLLEEVRRQKRAVSEEVLSPRPKRALSVIRRIAMAAGVMMLMSFAGGIGWMAGHDSARSGARFAPASLYDPQPVSSPHSYRVTFDDYTVPQSSTLTGDEAKLIRQLEASALSAIEQMTPDPGLYTPAPIPTEGFIRRLQTGEKLAGLLDFRKAVIKGPKKTAEILVPVLVSPQPQWESLLRAEQERLIKKLVSQVLAP